MKKLLIIAHTPSPNTEALAKSLELGCQAVDEPLTIERQSPFAVNTPMIEAADGLILFTTENFGYMSGAMKDLFDRTYNDLQETKQGTPYALIIRAGKDGTGTERAVESIVKGLAWKKVQACTILKGEFKQDFLEEVKSLGETFAAGLAYGIF